MTSHQWPLTQAAELEKAQKAFLAICEVYGLQAQGILPLEGVFERGEVTLRPNDFAFFCSALEEIQELVLVPDQNDEDEEAAQ